MTKLNSTVIETAEEEHEIQAKRIELAQEIYDDLLGETDSWGHHHGLRLAYYGDYLLVNDEVCKWLTTVDDFQSALDGVLEGILEGKKRLTSDDIAQFKCDAYSLLCSLCSDLYSTCNGSDAAEMVKTISEDLTDKAVDEICEALRINLAETLGTMAEWKTGDLIASYTITDDDCQPTHTYNIFLQSAEVCDRTVYRFAEILEHELVQPVSESGAATLGRQAAIDAGIEFANDADETDEGATVYMAKEKA